MNRKNLVISLLSIALIISSLTTVVIIVNYPKDSNPEDLSTLVVGTSAEPFTLDIVDAWDAASNDVLEQVVETLFSNDLRDPALPRINRLAESYYWQNTTSLQIKLHKDILFHDGTPFNSKAVKWNLDRLLYLTNCTGNNFGEIAYTRSLWMRPDGKTPIINSVDVIDEYNITITLNDPYGPFLNLLTCINAGMISPTAHSDNFHEFIPLSTKIIGTGPFVYEYYTPDVEVVLSRWKLYRENVAYFDRLQFKIFDDQDKAHEEMLAGTIDFNFMFSEANILAYETEENIIVKHYTDETGIPNSVYFYLSFNNDNFNRTCRKAMSYAINYSHIVEELRHGDVIQAKSPISPGFGSFFNETTKDPEFNITKAREIMISMGFGNISWSDSQWIAVAEGNSPFLVIEYTYIIGNVFREELGVTLTEWFKLIGIAVDDNGYTWIEAFTWGMTYNGMFCSGWAPDYLDPFNMLDPLVNPRSDSNIALINDSTLNYMMELALNTTNDITRNNIYKNIQSYFTEEGYFHAPLYHSKVVLVHSKDLQNVPYNAMGKFQAYGIWRTSL